MIETTPWRGERGPTALRVLRAHLNFASQSADGDQVGRLGVVAVQLLVQELARPRR